MTKNKPFNDVIDHYDKIEGNAANGSLKKLPKLRYFGYFFISFFALGIMLLIILNILL
ncbi:amino acid transporter [Neobacillus rhizophilus]|uniref:Amino acid transporter n=1 Tax=Neobacillus rhizophilus TaxID=2833579 RepID=A0A942YW96_9BACI|nr:amino acid transporter [Neobacillus rhizophilus]MBS4213810.1 amino acid transporter [Neobacillus rhizophilus]